MKQPKLAARQEGRYWREGLGFLYRQAVEFLRQEAKYLKRKRGSSQGLAGAEQHWDMVRVRAGRNFVEAHHGRTLYYINQIWAAKIQAATRWYGSR